MFVFGEQLLSADCNLLDQPRLELNSAEMRTKHDFSPQKFQMVEIDADKCKLAEILADKYNLKPLLPAYISHCCPVQQMSDNMSNQPF